MKKFEFRVSPEPLVSCAQAPPAKGHDGLWGREWIDPFLAWRYHAQTFFRRLSVNLIGRGWSANFEARFRGEKNGRIKKIFLGYLFTLYADSETIKTL